MMRVRAKRRFRWVLLGAALVIEVGAVWARARRLGGNVIVRCNAGHLFTTIWIPGVSAKALRLGWLRVQRCPVGHHWAIVTPVNETTLRDAERDRARACRDVRLP